jgi:DoxX-like family
MFTAYVVVTLMAVALNTYAAYVDFIRAEWVVANMTRYGIPHSWLFSLGALKGAGAAGLVIGLIMPPIGIAASAGLVAYFIGAIVTVMRAGWYPHLRYPIPFLLLAVASLVLRAMV